MAQRPPPCRGPLLCQTNPPPNPVCTRKPCLPNQSFADPVLYGRPRPCRTKSESQASTSQLRSARQRLGHYQDKQRQGTRWALARPNGAKARAGRSQGSPPGQTPATTPPADRCQGTRRTPIRPNGAMANAGRSQDSPPGQAPATTPPGRQTPGQAQDTHQTKRCRGKRKALARTSARRSLDQAAPGQAQDTLQGKHPPGQAPATTPPADRYQSTRWALARPSGARTSNARPSGAKVYKPKSPASMETGDFSCRDPELLVAVL